MRRWAYLLVLWLPLPAGAQTNAPQQTSASAIMRTLWDDMGHPIPPASAHWLTAPTVVVDVLVTQAVAITVVSIVTSQECVRVVFHKQGQWRTNDLTLTPPVIISTTTNAYPLSNAPLVR